METCIDLKVLGVCEDDVYIVAIPKVELSRLVRFSNSLKIRHLDGETPVVLETYGETAVRTREDGSEANNLANLPTVKSVVVSG